MGQHFDVELSSARPSVEVEAFSKHILDIHDEIRRRIAINNEKYTSHEDLKRKFAEFQERDEVMVHIRPKRYPKEDMGINNIFNIEDLTSYTGHLIDPGEKATKVSLPPTVRLRDEVYYVLDHQLVSIREKKRRLQERGLGWLFGRAWGRQRSSWGSLRVETGGGRSCNGMAMERLEQETVEGDLELDISHNKDEGRGGIIKGCHPHLTVKLCNCN
ncbi:hypothetical protein ACH5RR_003355 [Cinchona calisaya]|uniref:Uncharacterized protein n=1 Tax=Cinchona calisaya TaxID=153742 RepID=A0ABD3AUP3_9GENT